MKLVNQNNNLNGSSNAGYPYNPNILGNNLNSSGSLGRMISHSPQPHIGVNYQIGNGSSYNLNKNYQ